MSNAKKYDSTLPLFKKLNLLNFLNILKLFSYILALKAIKNDYTDNTFELTNHDYVTRGSYINLIIPQARYTILYVKVFCITSLSYGIPYLEI